MILSSLNWYFFETETCLFINGNETKAQSTRELYQEQKIPKGKYKLKLKQRLYSGNIKMKSKKTRAENNKLKKSHSKTIQTSIGIDPDNDLIGTTEVFFIEFTENARKQVTKTLPLYQETHYTH